MKRIEIVAFVFILTAMSCADRNESADAYGNFEVDEMTISAQVAGELLSFDLNEGSKLEKGQIYGFIDTTNLYLSRMEVLANIQVINSQYQNITAQINVLEAEKKNLKREIERTKRLVESEAATRKQLDDLEGSLAVAEQRVKAIKAQNPVVFSQLEVARVKLSQIDDKVEKSILKSPANGIVLNKIANTHQLLAPGNPLFRMADLSVMIFRAYVSGSQLSEISLGEDITVLVDHHEKELKPYKATVSWISEESEFTPKIIQTREERVDMVYAVKLLVKNDGSLKIGMPGEVVFNYAEGQ